MAENRHKTSINYLRLPIFTGKRSANPREVQIVEYEDGDTSTYLEIQNGNLSNFHRKMFLCLEYLYIKQNQHFESNYVRTTFKEILDVIQWTGNGHKRIYNSMRELQRVNITSIVKKKIEDGKVENTEGKQFSLFANIQWNMTTPFDERSEEGLRKYTGYFDVYFQEFHVQNLKSNYYRLINFELIRRLRPYSIRLFDFLNLNCYYLKDGRYIQKRSVQFDYEKMIQYLRLTKQNPKTYRERQFEKPLEELKENGVILSYSWEHDRHASYLLLNLARSINLWSRPQISEIENIQKLTPIEHKLSEYGVTPKQSEYLVAQFKEEYIHNKIEQFEYITRNIPEKIQGSGSYLYNSIKDDWREDAYTEYMAKKAQRELQLLSQKKKREQEEQHNRYEEFVHAKCLKHIEGMSEKERLNLQERVNKSLEGKAPWAQGTVAKFYRELERIRIVRDWIPVPSFEEWKGFRV